MSDFEDIIDILIFYEFFPALLVILLIALILLTVTSFISMCLLIKINSKITKRKRVETDFEWDDFTQF